MEHSLLHLLGLRFRLYHRYSSVMSWRGGKEEIIFTFTVLFYYYWGTIKELIGRVFWLFHWKCSSWCSSQQGRWGLILLLLFSFPATCNGIYFTIFVCAKFHLRYLGCIWMWQKWNLFLGLLGGRQKGGRSRGTGHDTTSLKHRKGEVWIVVDVLLNIRI